MSTGDIRNILTVTLNPTCDRIIEVPGFAVGAHLKGRLVSREPSGKAFNVSRALGTLCIPNTAVGWMGHESLDAFERAATAAGVIPRFTAIAGPTRENITIIDPEGRTETHIRDRGPAVSDSDVTRLLTELTALAMPGCMLVFSGSLAPGLSEERFCDMIRACTERGAAVVVDTSGEALRQAVGCRLRLIKPNVQELAELTGRIPENERELLGAMKTLRSQVDIVLVSAGEEGAYCMTEEGAWHGGVTLEPREVSSTVGCGDALLAGFIAAAVNGLATADCLREAVSAAAAAATSARPAFTLDQAKALTSRAKVRRLQA